jgi:hypothetical protein
MLFNLQECHNKVVNKKEENLHLFMQVEELVFL